MEIRTYDLSLDNSQAGQLCHVISQKSLRQTCPMAIVSTPIIDYRINIIQLVYLLFTGKICQHCTFMEEVGNVCDFAHLAGSPEAIRPSAGNYHGHLH